MGKHWILLSVLTVTAAVGVIGCSKGGSVDDDDAVIAVETKAENAVTVASTSPLDIGLAPASQERSSQTDEDVKGAAGCTEDCSDHNAGFAWAQSHSITNPDDCSNNSPSFVEGCRAYGEEILKRSDAAESAEQPDAQ